MVQCEKICSSYPICDCGNHNNRNNEVFPIINEIHVGEIKDLEIEKTLMLGVDWGTGESVTAYSLVQDGQLLIHTVETPDFQEWFFNDFNGREMKKCTCGKIDSECTCTVQAVENFTHSEVGELFNRCHFCGWSQSGCTCNEHLERWETPPKVKGWLTLIKEAINEPFDDDYETKTIDEVSKENRCSGCGEEHVNCKCKIF